MNINLTFQAANLSEFQAAIDYAAKLGGSKVTAASTPPKDYSESSELREKYFSKFEETFRMTKEEKEAIERKLLTEKEVIEYAVSLDGDSDSRKAARKSNVLDLFNQSLSSAAERSESQEIEAAESGEDEFDSFC